MADQARRSQEHAQTVARHGHDQTHRVVDTLQQYKPGFITFLVTGGILMFVGGLALTATVISLIVVTPVLIFFSPVLVPVGFLLFLAAAGTLTAGGFAIATVSAISWLYNYFKGRQPPSNQIDYARARIQDTAAHMRHKARDLAGSLQTAPGGAPP